jgi:hypothetical protein
MDKQIFYMCFAVNKCLVFLKENPKSNNEASSFIRLVGSRGSFSQDELKDLCNIGLKAANLRGDYSSIFQAAFSEKNPQKFPLLYTCQNLDNSVKVYDLNAKKKTP